MNHKKGSLVGASISQFLLEKNRVVNEHGAGEHNFHIFYYMLAGISKREGKALGLLTLSSDRYAFLIDNKHQFRTNNQGKKSSDEQYRAWEDLQAAFSSLAIGKMERLGMMRILRYVDVGVYVCRVVTLF